MPISFPAGAISSIIFPTQAPWQCTMNFRDFRSVVAEQSNLSEAKRLSKALQPFVVGLAPLERYALSYLNYDAY